MSPIIRVTITYKDGGDPYVFEGPDHDSVRSRLLGTLRATDRLINEIRFDVVKKPTAYLEFEFPSTVGTELHTYLIDIETGHEPGFHQNPMNPIQTMLSGDVIAYDGRLVSELPQYNDVTAYNPRRSFAVHKIQNLRLVAVDP